MKGRHQAYITVQTKGRKRIYARVVFLPLPVTRIDYELFSVMMGTEILNAMDAMRRYSRFRPWLRPLWSTARIDFQDPCPPGIAMVARDLLDRHTKETNA